MAVKMPTAVKVGAHTYTIFRRAKAQMPLLDGDRLYGCCDYDRLHLYLQKGLRKSKLKEFLLHEILHTAGFPNLNGKTLDEEEFVDKIAPILLGIIKENPELVAYLMEE